MDGYKIMKLLAGKLSQLAHSTLKVPDCFRVSSLELKEPCGPCMSMLIITGNQGIIIENSMPSPAIILQISVLS